MHDIFLIRHGMTEGNFKKRYIGVTDEELCERGKMLLEKIKEKRQSNEIDHVYVSPLKRCLETAEILYPGVLKTVIDGLRECNFGNFENKNYQELNGDAEYQKWIESGGIVAFPGGEDPKAFKNRSVKTFLETVYQAEKEKIAFVVHGGTIMSIMEALIQPPKSFYDWHVENGCGYHIQEDRGIFSLCEKISC